jgi:hypothetical protein
MSSYQIIMVPKRIIRATIICTQKGPVTPPMFGAAIKAARNAAKRPPERRVRGGFGLG